MKLLDAVALLETIPNSGLYKGQVGTIVEVYEPDVFEVEFCGLFLISWGSHYMQYIRSYEYTNKHRKIND